MTGDLLLFVVVISSAFYAFFVLRLIRGLTGLREFPVSESLPTVTVIIPARNEEAVIGRCVSSVLGQDYPVELLDVVVVDDDSEDSTAEVVGRFAASDPRVSLCSMMHREGLAVGQKPLSIMAGVARARGDIVLTTDADCIHPVTWVRAMVSYFVPGVAMVAGPVQLEHSETFFGKIEELDFFALVVTSAGLIGAHRPIICNGANLAIRRDAYNAVRDDVQVSSNDDGTLMSRIVTRGVGKIGYAFTNAAVVRTEGKGSLRGFFAQRRRWASVRNRYLDWTIYAELALLFLFFLSSLVLLVVAPLQEQFLAWAVAVWGLKGLLDWIALARGTNGMGVRLPLWMFIPALVFQPFGWVLATGLSVLSRFEWKGRRFNR